VGKTDKSLLAQAYERLRGITTKDRIFVVAHNSQTSVVKKQLPGLPSRNIIAEPARRNTAAAIGLAAVIIGRISPDAVMVVVPADQFICDKMKFLRLMKKAARLAAIDNSLVTIGIRPVYPATGYGYIKKAPGESFRVVKFVEKPDLAKAKRFVKNGYLWNSGMFVWEVTAILEALRDHMPRLYGKLFELDNHPGRFKAALARAYASIASVSIDYGVLEKSKKVLVIPSNLKWDDVGSWLSMMRLLPVDKDGNAVDANFKGIRTKNCIVVSKDKRHLVATYGLKDTIVVQTPWATLVSSADGTQDIRDLVKLIGSDAKTKGFC
jgi:mannose-1-phosphate guanylyltransferase